MLKDFHMSIKIHTSLRDWGKFYVTKFLQLPPELFNGSLCELKGEEWILRNLLEMVEMVFDTEAPQRGPFLWREGIVVENPETETSSVIQVRVKFPVMWSQYLQEMDITVSLCQLIQLMTPLPHLLHLHLQGLWGDLNLSCCCLRLSSNQLPHREVASLDGVDDAGQDALTVVLCFFHLLLFRTQLCGLSVVLYHSVKCLHLTVHTIRRHFDHMFSSPESVRESSPCSSISFLVSGESAWTLSVWSSAPPSVCVG